MLRLTKAEPLSWPTWLHGKVRGELRNTDWKQHHRASTRSVRLSGQHSSQLPDRHAHLTTCPVDCSSLQRVRRTHREANQRSLLSHLLLVDAQNDLICVLQLTSAKGELAAPNGGSRALATDQARSLSVIGMLGR